MIDAINMADSSNSEHDTEAGVLTGVLDDLANASSDEKVSIGQVIHAFEERSFGALATVIGVVAAMPLIGAIPGMSILTGTLILLIAGQYVFGREHPWIPSSLRNREISEEKLAKAVEKSRPVTKWIDRYVNKRLNWLVEGRIQRRLIAVTMCLLALTMIPLALVPWGVQPPATAIVFLGVAMLGRDGYFAAAGYALTIVTAYVMLLFWDTMMAALSAVFG